MTEAQKTITLDRLDKCHKAIFQVATFIDRDLLYSSNGNPIPTPQDDQLENLDRKWISTKDLKQLHDFWNKRKQETDMWDNFTLP